MSEIDWNERERIKINKEINEGIWGQSYKLIEIIIDYRPRGFAAMSKEFVKSIAKKGGIAAHLAGTAHEFSQEEARIAGHKGGKATHRLRRNGGSINSQKTETST